MKILAAFLLTIMSMPSMQRSIFQSLNQPAAAGGATLTLAHSTACSSTTCTVTTTTAGNALLAVFPGVNASGHITSVTGNASGAFTHDSACRFSGAGVSQEIDAYYLLAITGGDTTVTIVDTHGETPVIFEVHGATTWGGCTTLYTSTPTSLAPSATYSAATNQFVAAAVCNDSLIDGVDSSSLPNSAAWTGYSAVAFGVGSAISSSSATYQYVGFNHGGDSKPAIGLTAVPK